MLFKYFTFRRVVFKSAYEWLLSMKAPRDPAYDEHFTAVPQGWFYDEYFINQRKWALAADNLSTIKNADESHIKQRCVSSSFATELLDDELYHGATCLFPVIRLVTHERVRLSCLYEQNSFLGTLSKFPLFLLDTANTHTTENSFRMNPVS